MSSIVVLSKQWREAVMQSSDPHRRRRRDEGSILESKHHYHSLTEIRSLMTEREESERDLPSSRAGNEGEWLAGWAGMGLSRVRAHTHRRAHASVNECAHVIDTSSGVVRADGPLAASLPRKLSCNKRSRTMGVRADEKGGSRAEKRTCRGSQLHACSLLTRPR